MSAPVTPLLFAAYGAGLWLLNAIRERPMWSPVLMDLTRKDVGGDGAEGAGAGEGEDLNVGPYHDAPPGRL